MSLSRSQVRRSPRLLEEAKISLGEAEASVLAKDNRALAALYHKEVGVLVKSLGPEYTSTVMLLYEAFVRRIISYDDLEGVLARLTKAMRISTGVITEIIRKAREVKRWRRKRWLPQDFQDRY